MSKVRHWLVRCFWARAVWVATALALLSVLAVLVPASPVSAQDLDEAASPEPVPEEPVPEEEPQPEQPELEEVEPEQPEPEQPELGEAQLEEAEPQQPQPEAAEPADGVNPFAATVGDRVWIDLDQDGFQDPGEPGVPNIDVEIWRSPSFGELWTYIGETVTDADGRWSIVVPPDSYAARILIPRRALDVTLPDNVDLALGEAESDQLDSDAYRLDDDFAITAPFVLESGDERLDIDLGLDPLYSDGFGGVGGRVWGDLDGDAIRDLSEPGLSDVRVSLIDVADGLVVADTVTEFDGDYRLSVPQAGNYVIEIGESSTFVPTPIAGDNDVGLDRRSEPVTFDFWTSGATVHAGLVPGTGDVQGTAFVDVEANGVRDAGDPPAAFVQIELRSRYGTQSAFTDGNGEYRFAGVTAGGDYQVVMEAPPGNQWTLSDIGDDGTDSDVDGNGESAAFTVTNGSVTEIDGGFFAPVRLTIASLEIPDPVWSATIEIDGEEMPWDLAPVERTFTPGSTVQISQQLTPFSQWSVDGIVCNDGALQDVTSDVAGTWSAEVTLVVDTDCVFQNRWRDTTRVYGIVFEDKNHSSLRDNGDERLAGVVVELRSLAGDLVATTETDADGQYVLEAPGAGAYSVIVIAPADMRFAWRVFGAETIDSDVDLSGEARLYLADGEAVPIDAGLLRDVTVEGIFWLDEDEDGQRGEDEPPVPDVFVGVRQVPVGRFYTTRTDVDGRYSFDRLPPGRYEVQVSGGSQGVRFTEQGVGAEETDSDFFSYGASEQIEVPSGTAQIDGGLRPSVTIEVNLTDPAGWGYEPPAVQLGIHREDLEVFGQTFAVVPMSFNLLEAWFEPADEWAVTGLDCTGPATVGWADRGDGYSRASIEVGAVGEVVCSYQVTHLPTRPVEVTLVVEGPADAPPVLVEATSGLVTEERRIQSYTTALTPTRSETLLLEPRRLAPAVLAIPVVPAGWSATFECDDRIGVEVGSSSARTEYRLDLLAIAGGSATCTIAMAETAPASVAWTNTHQGASTPAIDLFLNLRAVSSGATNVGSAVVPVVPGSVAVVLSVDPQSAVLESLACEVDGVTIEASSIFEGYFARVTVEEVGSGATVTCTSSTSDPNTAQLTLIADGNGTANVTVNAQYSETQFVDVVDQATIDVARSNYVWINVDVGPNRRFLAVQCDRFVERQPVERVGFFQLDMSDRDATCTIVTTSEPNRPIGVRLVPVAAADQVLPPLGIRETYLTPSEPWSSEGVRREHFLGVLSGTSAVDGFISYLDLPFGWRAGEATCTGRADPITGRASVTVDLGLVDPGSEIVCEVEIERLTSGTQVTLRAEWEGATPQPLPFGFSGSTPQTLVPGEAVSFFTERSDTLNVYPIPGHAFMAFDCGNGVGSVTLRGDAVAALTWGFNEEPPDRFDCVVTVAPVTPVELTISTEVEGARGNGEVRFQLEADGFRETVIIDGANTVQIAVPVGILDLTAELPVTWRNLDVQCDRLYGAAIDGTEVELDLRSGEQVKCTFTNQLANQNVGVSGDVTCDGVVDIIDALVIAQYDAGVRSGGATCPLASASTELFTGAADFDSSGRIDILDALQVARCTVGLPAPACPSAAGVELQ